MTIRYLDRSQLDSALWDDCIDQSSQRLIYAFSWYLDALTTGVGAPHWGGILAEDQGEYKAVMPVVFKKKYGIRYVYQPDYCQQLGIFSREEILLNTVSAVFFEQFIRYFKWVVSYRFNENNERELSFPSDISVLKRCNHILSLNTAYEEIHRKYAPDRRSNLKRARNSGWIVAHNPDIRPLIHLHRTHNEKKAVGAMKLDLTIYERFANAVDELNRRGLVRIWMVRKSGEKAVEAGGLFVLDRNRIIYLFNGASVTGRKQQGRLWMIDQLIKEFAGQPMVFDFESPAVGANPVKAYYQSFGAETRFYTEISYNRLPLLVKWGQAVLRTLLSLKKL